MMHSTMGAPLAPPEEEAIQNAWFKLVRTGQSLEIAQGTFARGEDQVQMLEQATNLILQIYELRGAISNAWHYANRRAFPDPDRSAIGALHRRRTRPPLSREATLAALDLTQDELDEMLATMQPKGVTP